MRTVLTAVSICLLQATAAAAADFKVVDDPEELRKLYSNKTFRGKSFDGSPSVAYYRADGKALWIAGERRIPRTWEIKGRDQVCYEDEVLGRNCVRIQRDAANPREILVQQVGGNWGGFVTVEDGIPKF
jgi:hypothetical protein